MLYIYSCVVSVDHFSCGNESQFEKWWQDSKQNPVEVTYRIHHSIISNKNKVSQTVFILCKMWQTKSPPDCVLADYEPTNKQETSIKQHKSEPTNKQKTPIKQHGYKSTNKQKTPIKQYNAESLNRIILLHIDNSWSTK
jgi:hypothetical protein